MDPETTADQSVDVPVDADGEVTESNAVGGESLALDVQHLKPLAARSPTGDNLGGSARFCQWTSAL